MKTAQCSVFTHNTHVYKSSPVITLTKAMTNFPGSWSFPDVLPSVLCTSFSTVNFLQYFTSFSTLMLLVKSWLGLLTCKTHYRVGAPTAAWQFVDIVNIDCLTMVDNTSAVDNNSHPWVVPQLINGCQLPRGRDGSLQIQSLVEFLISSGPL